MSGAELDVLPKNKLKYEAKFQNSLLSEYKWLQHSTKTGELVELIRTVPGEEFLEMDITPVIGVRDIRRWLIDQYKTMKHVSLSAYYKENLVDVSQVYCELEIMSLGIEDEEGREIFTSDNKIFSSTDAEDVGPFPAMIIGECGSGKSTWCKNLVHQWCQYHDNKEPNLDLKDSSIPDIARFEILLYIQLKKQLEDASFMEHLGNTLFPNATDYYEYTRSYILEHRGYVLLLIDGFDELTCNFEPIVNLLKEKEIFPCSIVLTSRPSGLECLQEKYGISLRLFQIQGEKLHFDDFWKFADHIQVLSMCHIPLLCLSLIMFWIESKAISADITDVLFMIAEYYLRRAMMREWYKVNIGQVLEQQQFDISIFIAKTRNKHYLRDHGYLLKVIGGVAENLCYLQMGIDTNKQSVRMETNTIDDGNDVKFCLETGFLMKTFRDKLERSRSQIIFSHTLLFDFFVALSITMEKGESFTRCITTKKSVVKNSYMIHMICQLAPNIGQGIIKDISKIFDKDRNEKTEMSDQHLICNIECKDSKLQGVNLLKTLMHTDKLSNAKLSLLTEGLKITKEVTHFDLELPENKNELIFRLPILPNVQALKVDIENCTLLLHEEQEWNKGNSSELSTFVIKSVNIDVKTTGYIIEAISTCKDLLKLEFCPKDNSNAQILALGSKKTFYGWGCLAEGIKDMTKLSTVRLHNVQIGEHLPALLYSLCRCPMMEILELMNLKEIGTGEILKVNASDRGLYDCKHHEAKQLENSKRGIKILKEKPTKILQLIMNAMSEKSWLTLSEQLECLSPHIVQIEQVYQSSLVVNELLQGIGKCKDLNCLSVCSIPSGNHLVVFSVLGHLHKLKKLTLCKLQMPDSSWKELSEILARLAKLKELSLAHMEIKNCFIDVHKLSKVKLLEMKEVHLEEALWSKLGDEVITLPCLEMFKLVSCEISKKEYFFFLEKMKRSTFDVEMTTKSNVDESEMLSIDMVMTSKKELNPGMI